MRDPTSARLLVAVSALIATADLAQVLLLDWRPKFIGALGGAAIYSAVALGALGGEAWPRRIALFMPLIPLCAAAAWAVGLSPAAPDRWMAAIFGLQLVAAGGALAASRATSSPPSDD